MTKSKLGLVCAFIGTLALGACATGSSTAIPEGNSGTAGAASATARQPKVVYTVADAGTEAKIPYQYQLIRRSGVDFYCHTEAVTGSRTQKKHVCRTKAQMEAEHNRTADTVAYADGR